MRYLTCIGFALCCCASFLDYQSSQNGQQQPSTPEKQQVSKQGTQNPEANELYLKGRSYWDKRTLPDLETAVSYFNQAIAKDPGYALAYAGLADAYAILPDNGGDPREDIPKSDAAARKALELDSTLARPHADLGYNKMLYEFDFAKGEAEFKKALADMKCPAEVYQPSLRPYTGLPDIDYPFHDKTIVVTRCGRICLGNKKIKRGIHLTQLPLCIVVRHPLR